MLTTRSMICAKCGYDLRGLPQRGGCPECGSTYNKDTLNGIASLNSAYRRSENISFWLKIAALILSALMIMGCAGILSYFAKTPSKPLVTGGFMCCMLLLIAIAMIVLKKMDDKED
ncbi:MAG: hypothetical protein JKX85_05195 [Phycisphaeraceae bacterium]|nr:hypothetical protein [Phycisphaeraceae bacterium]